MSTILPGQIRQNGYVVRDLDATIAAWRGLGIGPWYTIRELSQRLRIRGVESEPIISIAFSNSGPLQIELIQQHNDAPSAYKEYTDQGREGFHHVAFWAEDYEASLASALSTGLKVFQDDGGGDTRFAYFEADGVTSTAIELSELNAETAWMNRMVAAAAADWDGVTDPVRSLM